MTRVYRIPSLPSSYFDFDCMVQKYSDTVVYRIYLRDNNWYFSHERHGYMSPFTLEESRELNEAYQQYLKEKAVEEILLGANDVG